MVSSVNVMHAEALVKFVRYSLYALITALTVAGLYHYTGQWYVYLLFSLASNTLLYYGFRKDSIFFDTIIGIFFWLGFWLKFTVRAIFYDGRFHESVGHFDGSAASFDRALFVASCGMVGLLVASAVRERYFFRYPKTPIQYTHAGILNFYKKYRRIVLTGFIVLFLSVAFTNIFLGIYQRGEITQTVLPFGLNGVFKWLLLFGLASISAVLWQCELSAKREASYTMIFVSLFESLLSSVSMLSRGMILNVSALGYGIYSSVKNLSIKWTFRALMISLMLFALFFASSVVLVNYLRSASVGATSIVSQSERISTAKGLTNALFLDRWVGIEGVMAVSSYDQVGWGLWTDAWAERYSENAMTLYDKHIISSTYTDSDIAKKHSISMPGIVGFCFYPGSYIFLFGCMFVMGLFAAMIELAVFKLGGNNLILCSLIAEVVAYRFANFGYVPAQSYLLFGTIFLNLLAIYYGNKFVGLLISSNKTH